MTGVGKKKQNKINIEKRKGATFKSRQANAYWFCNHRTSWQPLTGPHQTQPAQSAHPGFLPLFLNPSFNRGRTAENKFLSVKDGLGEIPESCKWRERTGVKSLERFSDLRAQLKGSTAMVQHVGANFIFPKCPTSYSTYKLDSFQSNSLPQG